jgi:hypothetical protein
MCSDVVEGLQILRGEVAADDARVFVPGDLPRDVQERAGGDDAIGVTTGLGEVRWLDGVHGRQA